VHGRQRSRRGRAIRPRTQSVLRRPLDTSELRPKFASVLQVLVWFDEDLALIHGAETGTRAAFAASPDAPSRPASRRDIGTRIHRGLRA
jgi:hypothetical protein